MDGLTDSRNLTRPRRSSYTSALKTEAVSFSKKLITIYQTTRRQIPEDSNLRSHHKTSVLVVIHHHHHLFLLLAVSSGIFISTHLIISSKFSYCFSFLHHDYY
jgi:hypothetical protein